MTISIGKLCLSSTIGLAGMMGNAFPANPQQFTVSPMVTIVDSIQGQSKGSINVTNNGNEPVRMRVYAESFTYDRKKGFVFTGVDDRSAVPYLQFSPRELEIPPGVTRNVRVGVVLPANLPNQEYRAAIFIEDLKEQDTTPRGGSLISIKTRVASVFFFGKGNGSADIQVRMAAWDATSRRISILVENKGKKSAYPEVNWQIEKDGRKVAENILRGVVVQSQNDREVTLQSQGQPLNLTSGEYKLLGTISTQGQKPTPFSIKLIVP
jgi:hypothetical protein